MTDLSPVSEDERFAQLREAVREHNSAKIRDLLTALGPYVDGTMGPVSPAHARVYLESLKQLGQLWKVFDRLPEAAKEEEETDQVVLVRMEEQRARVLAELTKLREIADRRG